MLQQHAWELWAVCCQCHLWHTHTHTHSLDLKTTWACLMMCLIIPPTQTPMRISFVKTMDAKNISGLRGWDQSDGGGDWSQETCLHVLTKQKQTRRATKLWMKQSRSRSQPIIHLSFNQKVLSHESFGRNTCTSKTPAGKLLISSLDMEGALVRLPGAWSPVCWKYLLVVTGKDEWMSQRCNKSAAVGQFCDFEGGTFIKREKRLPQITSFVFQLCHYCICNFYPPRRKEGEAKSDREVKTCRDMFPLMWTEKGRTKGCVLEVEVTQ